MKKTHAANCAGSDGRVLPSNLRSRPPIFVRGEGIYLYDDQGNRYMDGACGVGVSNIGHGVSEIVSVMARQAQTLAFTYSGNARNIPSQELAAIFDETTPPEMGEVRTLFCSGGAEANEAAIKLTYQYHWERGHPTKRRFVGRWQSFHGNTLGTLAVSGRTAWRRMHDSIVADCPHIPPPYCFRCPWGLSYPSCKIQCAEELRRTIQQLGPENVAGFIAEPIIGTSMSAVVAPAEYFAKVREICDEFDVLFIADEVMSGAGRSGTMWAIEQWGIAPDIITAAKGIAGGYASLGAALVSEKVWTAFSGGSGKVMHSCTYGGNPLSCAVGVAVAHYIRDNDLVTRAGAEGARLMDQLRSALADVPWVGDVRGRGLFLGVEIVHDRRTASPFPTGADATSRIEAEALKRGLLVLGGAPGLINGVAGDHIEILPPYTISRGDAEWLVATLREAIVAALETHGVSGNPDTDT